MYPITPVPPLLSRLLASQEGVVTRGQARPHLSDEVIQRLVRSGAWTRVAAGVYATAPTPSMRQRLWAAHLLGGPESALGGHAALAAAGLTASLETALVWLPPGVRRQRRPGMEFRVDGLGRLLRRTGTLPVIRLEDALLDLSETLPLQEWVSLVTDALRSGRVGLRRLREGLEGRDRLSRRRDIAACLADLEGVESPLELRYLRDVERAHGLPQGRRQVTLLPGTRSDTAYEPWGVIVELDGTLHLAQTFRDLERDNRNSLGGRTTLRYGSADVYSRPCKVARQVARALAMRGWTGALHPCRRCPGPR